MVDLAAVIVNFRTAEQTVHSVRSLTESRRHPEQLIVVDNASDHGLAARLREVAPETQLIETGRNLGFGGGCNLGIRLALERGADRIFLLNSDAEVTPDCLGLLERALAPAEVGMVGPAIVATDRVTIESLGIDYVPWSGRMQQLGAGLRLDGVGRATRPVTGLSGAAMLLKRSTLERVGLFDEDYFFYFEDLDLCLRARKAGLGSRCVPGAVVYHAGSVSIGRRSPRRIYFATRNHLRCAVRALPLPPPLGALRAIGIVGLNLAHLLRRAPAPVGAGLLAIGRAAWHHARSLYGADGAGAASAASSERAN